MNTSSTPNPAIEPAAPLFNTKRSIRTAHRLASAGRKRVHVLHDPVGKLPAHDTRLALHKLGYEPLPIPEGTKGCHVTGWSKAEITPEWLAPYQDWQNTGIRCGTGPYPILAIDIDIYDPAAVRRIIEIADETFGPSPCIRHGEKGAMLVYRLAGPCKPKVYTVRREVLTGEPEKRAYDGKVHHPQIEVRSNGQFVAFGRHPSGVEYKWVGHPYDMGDAEIPNRSLLEVPATDLLEVTPEEIDEFAARLFKAGLIEDPADSGKDGATPDGDEQRPTKTYKLAEVREAMRYQDPRVAYDQGWVLNCLRIMAARIEHDDGHILDEHEQLAFAYGWSHGLLGTPEKPGEPFGVSDAVDEDDLRRLLRTSSRKERKGDTTLLAVFKEAYDKGWTGNKPPPPDPSRSAQEAFGITQPGDQRAGEPEPAKIAEADAALVKRYGIKSATEAASPAVVEHLIKDLVFACTLVVMFAPPKSYKSFLALDMALSIACGLSFLGHECLKPGPVLYLSGEGRLGARIDGWHIKRKRDAGDMFAEGRLFPMTNAGEIDRLKELVGYLKRARLKGKNPVLIVVDTVARAMAGSEENSTRDMGILIDACAELQREYDCTVLLVHHTPKGDASQMRGSGALGGGVDTSLLVAKDEKRFTATLTVDFQKDGESGEVITAAMDKVETRWTKNDASGSLVTTLVPRLLSQREGAVDRPQRLSDEDTNRLVLLRVVKAIAAARPDKKQCIPNATMAGRVVAPLEAAGWVGTLPAPGTLRNSLARYAKKDPEFQKIARVHNGEFLGWDPRRAEAALEQEKAEANEVEF